MLLTTHLVGGIMRFKLKSLGFFILGLMLGFDVIAPSPSWADSVSASASLFFSPASCSIAAAPVSASCSSTDANGFQAASFANLATGTLTASVNGDGSASATLTACISLVLPSGYSASYVPVRAFWPASQRRAQYVNRRKRPEIVGEFRVGYLAPGLQSWGRL